ncbi:DVUA0089 family protein [Breznakiella homolactica]|uniref:DVUA0089 family protein n=1 Tax=Breznakiella homolactica TaxID=2798577 RepID=A0A7T8B925_9SPIR|nr:DVUA0089 family protein [Breznakiella homolactica]QQO08012.1 DVUA0089 family protein [Breznakiella homolactica]
MARPIRWMLFFVLCTAASVQLTAQQQVRPESMADLDRENQRLADMIIRTVDENNSGTAVPEIQIGGFYFKGYEIPLGTYWSQNLLQSLINGAGRKFKIIDTYSGGLTASASTASLANKYSLRGEIVEIGSMIRIYTRLVKMDDVSLLAGWQSDFENTPFLWELLQTSGSSLSNVPRDMYEPDSRENPVTMEVGGNWMNRTIHANDVDWFLVQTNGPGLLSIEVEGDFDSYLEFYSGTGYSLLDENDDYDGNNPRIQYFTSEAASYIVKLRPYSDSTGSYSIRAQLLDMDITSMEPNNTRAQAFEITLGEPVTGYFQDEDDVEWFKVRVPSDGGLLVVYTTGNQDTKLTLYDERGRKLAEDDDSGSEYNAKVSTVAVGGLYFIELTDYDGARGLYTLHTEIRDMLGVDEYEPDNTFSSAKPIDVGAEPQRRTFTDSSDVDWVRFTVTQRGYYGIRAQGENDLSLDTYIELYDEDQDLIDEDDDGGEYYDSYLRVRLDPGTYWIKVSTLDSEPSDFYLLSVEFLR